MLEADVQLLQDTNLCNILKIDGIEVGKEKESIDSSFLQHKVKILK